MKRSVLIIGMSTICLAAILWHSVRRIHPKVQQSGSAASIVPATNVAPNSDPIPVPRLTPKQAADIEEAFNLRRPAGATGMFTALILNPRFNKMGLTPQQLNELQKAYDKYRADRLAYEASIAKPSFTATGMLRLDIPPYPSEGMQLAQMFRADLVSRLGGTVASAVLATYEQDIASDNAGLGSEAQTYLVSDDPTFKGQLRVERTWTAPNGMNGDVVSQVSEATTWNFGALAAYFPYLHKQ